MTGKAAERPPRKHFSYVRNLHLADVVTLGNGFCGSLSVLESMKYLSTRDEWHLWCAILYLPAATFLDWLDGRVARWRNKSSLLGQELDSLADLISFGVAPVVLAFATGLHSAADMFILSFFVCCGISRLARYNATVANLPRDAAGRVTHFEGIPMPTSLLLVMLNALMLRYGLVNQNLPFGSIRVPVVGEVHLLSLLYLGFASAFVSKRLRIRKW